jgi:hypothetical protein
MLKETTDLVILVARLANGVSKSLEDGKISMGDALNFVPALVAIPSAIANCSEIPTELMNATPEDKDELLDSFKREFSIDNASAEAMIEKVIEFIVAFWKLLKTQKIA